MADGTTLVGEITEETQIGTLFDFGAGETATLLDINADGVLSMVNESGDPVLGLDGVPLTMDYWNDEYAPLIEETDLPEPAEVPEPEEPDEPAETEESLPDPTGDEYRAQQTLADIQAQNKSVEDARKLYEKFKGQASEAKKLLDNRSHELSEMIAGTEADEMPLFEGATDETPPEAPKKLEDWRNVPLSSLDLSPGVLTAFSKNDPPLVTVGDFVDWQAEKGDFWAKDIKGLGPKAVDKIADVMDRFWADHPQPASEE